VRYGYTPDIVDSWPVAWSSGWLLERAMELEGSPEKWTGQPVGFGLDDPDWDPAFDASEADAPDVSHLPFYDPEGVSRGE
jgi:hypothetical protein